MKNIILGIFGAFLAVYTAIMGLCMYNIYARKDELDNCLSEVLESIMEEYYVGDCFVNFKNQYSDVQIQKCVEEALRLRTNLDSDMEITFLACDMEKGILSVAVKESFPLPNGKTKTISAKKTLISDRTEEAKEVIVQFYAGDELYKEYRMTEGQKLIPPKSPEGDFKGWKQQGEERIYDFSSGNEVWKNIKFEAVY